MTPDPRRALREALTADPVAWDDLLTDIVEEVLDDHSATVDKAHIEKLILDYLAALPVEAEPPTCAWQPIATAPKDGTAILAFFPDAAEHFGVMKVQLLEFEDDPDGPGWYLADIDNGRQLDVEPTHWMPLPTPPTEDR